jgi:Mg2+ and Co2+ transporter CorA
MAKETYLQRAVTIANELHSLDVQLHTTEELMHMKSDTMRNRLLFVNMLVAIFAMVLSMTLLITGFFGMNVGTNDPLFNLYQGENGRHFLPVVFGSLAATVVLFGVLLFLIWKVGFLSAAV